MHEIANQIQSFFRKFPDQIVETPTRANHKKSSKMALGFQLTVEDKQALRLELLLLKLDEIDDHICRSHLKTFKKLIMDCALESIRTCAYVLLFISNSIYR